ncbi:MAG TPA: hypothetical protein VGM88_17855 [Kofleriaceae bacterium]
MRTRTVFAALGLSLLAACTIGNSAPKGGGSGDDDTTGDDTAGDDTSTPTPMISGSVDKTTVSTELGKDEVVTLTVASANGFAGAVTIAPSLETTTGTSITDVTVAGPTSLTLTAGGTQTAQYTVHIPTNTSQDSLAANLNLSLTSTAAPASATSAITIANQYTFTYAAGTGATVANHETTGMTVTLKRGAKMHFTNADTMIHETHGPVINGTNYHESDSGGQPGATYEVDTIAMPPGTYQFGCHDHGAGTYASITME